MISSQLCSSIYRSFDFNNISCSKTFLSKYIDFLILTIYLTQKPFQANILIFWFYDISHSKTFQREYIDFLILTIYLARKPFRANISIFWFLRYILLKNLTERIYRFFDFINIHRLKTFPSEIFKFWIFVNFKFRFCKIQKKINFQIFKFHLFYKKSEILKKFQNLGI